MVAPLGHHDFEPHVGQRFRFSGSDVELLLARIDVGERQAGLERAPFTLIFHGPAGGTLPEGMYSGEIEGGGAVQDIYVIPIHTPARDRQEYQAVFN